MTIRSDGKSCSVPTLTGVRLSAVTLPKRRSQTLTFAWNSDGLTGFGMHSSTPALYVSSMYSSERTGVSSMIGVSISMRRLRIRSRVPASGKLISKMIRSGDSASERCSVCVGSDSRATFNCCCCKLNTHSGPVVCWLLTINTLGVRESLSDIRHPCDTIPPLQNFGYCTQMIIAFLILIEGAFQFRYRCVLPAAYVIASGRRERSNLLLIGEPSSKRFP